VAIYCIFFSSFFKKQAYTAQASVSRVSEEAKQIHFYHLQEEQKTSETKTKEFQ
jgi:hypothetical protein